MEQHFKMEILKTLKTDCSVLFDDNTRWIFLQSQLFFYINSMQETVGVGIGESIKRTFAGTFLYKIHNVLEKLKVSLKNVTVVAHCIDE